MLDTIMPRNEHAVERVIRVALGLLLVGLVFVGPQTPWGWLGLALVATGLVGSCPLYTLLGVSTRRAPAG